MSYQFNASLGLESEFELLHNIKSIVKEIVISSNEWTFLTGRDESRSDRLQLQFIKQSLFYRTFLFIDFTPYSLNFANVRKFRRFGKDPNYNLGKDDRALENEIVDHVREMYRIKEETRQKNNQSEISILKAALKKKNISQYFISNITANQAKIETSLIPNLLKIQAFYEKQVTTYNLIYANINAIDFFKSASYQKDQIISSLKEYAEQISGLQSTQNVMIDAYINADLVTFFSIYNKFDEMGLLISGGEKAIINNIQDLNSNLDNVLYSIDAVNRNIETFRPYFKR